MDLHPTQLPGYNGGPFTRRPELLGENLFWLGHLHSCVHSEEAEQLLFGANYRAAGEFRRRVWKRADWPAFTIPLLGGHRIHVVYRTFEEDEGIDYLLHHPDWERAELIARDDGHFMGPGLSWPELIAAADTAVPGGTSGDALSRVLLLLPAFGDDDTPNSAVDRLATAVRARTNVEAPDLVAAELLRSQGAPGPVRWTTTDDGVRVSTGRYSFRNPANRFALPTPRLARVSDAFTLKS
jgi:hypothetical protein